MASWNPTLLAMLWRRNACCAVNLPQGLFCSPPIAHSLVPPPRAPLLALPAGWESELLDLVNAARAEQGMGSLCLNSKLMAAAQAHSADQAANQNMSHDGSDGSSHIERAQRAGYDSTYVAENVSAHVCITPCCTAKPALRHATPPCPAAFSTVLHAALRAP